MATTREKSERNGAAASYLQSIRVAQRPKVTYTQIAERTGIRFETIKRLMNNLSEFSVDDFLSIAEAIGVDDATALSALSKVVRKQSI